MFSNGCSSCLMENTSMVSHHASKHAVLVECILKKSRDINGILSCKQTLSASGPVWNRKGEWRLIRGNHMKDHMYQKSSGCIFFLPQSFTPIIYYNPSPWTVPLPHLQACFLFLPLYFQTTWNSTSDTWVRKALVSKTPRSQSKAKHTTVTERTQPTSSSQLAYVTPSPSNAPNRTSERSDHITRRNKPLIADLPCRRSPANVGDNG